METNSSGTTPSTVPSGGNPQQALIPTPRTQSAIHACWKGGLWSEDFVDHAKQLERDLTAAHDERDAALKQLDEIRGHLRRVDKSLPTAEEVINRLAKYHREQKAHLDGVEEVWRILCEHGFTPTNDGWVDSIKIALKEHNALLTTARRLVMLVEGASMTDFRDQNGNRLKDYAEWCAFYVAVRSIER